LALTCHAAVLAAILSIAIVEGCPYTIVDAIDPTALI